MMKAMKLRKILVMMLILISITILPTTIVKAGSFLDDVLEWGDDFLQNGKESASLNQNEASTVKSKEIVSILYDTLQTLGVYIAIGVGGVLGIKFMTSSAEDKAKVKEYLVPYVVGCIAIFGAFGIWKLVINVMSGI